MKVLSIDPGGTTGVALWDNGKLISVSEGPLWAPFVELVPQVDLVVVEKLSWGPSPALAQAVEVVGALKLLAEMHHEFVVEQPTAFRAGPRARYGDLLREIRSPHIRDAVYHGISFWERRELTWTFTFSPSVLA